MPTGIVRRFWIEGLCEGLNTAIFVKIGPTSKAQISGFPEDSRGPIVDAAFPVPFAHPAFRQAWSNSGVDLAGIRDCRLGAGFQAGEGAGHGRPTKGIVEPHSGIEAGCKIAAERIAGADRIDRLDDQP